MSHPVGADSPKAKYELDIEGTPYPWDEDTITIAQLRTLGHLPASEPVLVIDADNNQHTMAEDEVIHLVPGLGFSKKVKWRRG